MRHAAEAAAGCVRPAAAAAAAVTLVFGEVVVGRGPERMVKHTYLVGVEAAAGLRVRARVGVEVGLGLGLELGLGMGLGLGSGSRLGLGLGSR